MVTRAGPGVMIMAEIHLPNRCAKASAQGVPYRAPGALVNAGPDVFEDADIELE